MKRAQKRRKMRAQRQGQRLLEEIANGASLRPHRDLSSILARTLAVLVHCSTILLVGVGIWFLIARPSVTLVVVGVLLLAIAVVLRPHIERLPAHTPLFDRPAAPELFAMVDDIARTVGTRSVNRIGVDGDFNASVSVYGIRGRRLLMIGMPLWVVLSPDERVALLGHELGHLVNGDLRHGALVWSAAESLRSWSYLLRPSGRGNDWLVGIFAYLPWKAVQGIRTLLYRLTFRAAQRGEYLADRFSASAGGAEAASSLLDKIFLESVVSGTIDRERSLGQVGPRTHGNRDERVDALWQRIVETVNSVPESEIARRRLAGEKRGHAVDSSHPPTHLRRAILLLAQAGSPEVVIDAAREGRIEAELFTARRTVGADCLSGM
jgi:Zn-dependent protease with chaperone function